ncbi:MAG TPA: peptidylprolyl isomerase [Ignavibacteria bacterium]
MKNLKNLFFILFLVSAFVIAGCGKNENKTDVKKEENKIDTVKTQIQNTTPQTEQKKDTVKKEDANVKTDEKSTGDVMKIVTTMGTIKIKLFPDKAPKTVEHIKALVNKGFYNGIIFHRVIDGFMIQGGDPTGTGSGNSGQTIPDEFGNGLKHNKAGIVAMANTGRPNSQDSQFYITLDATPTLDGKYTVFGEVIDGLDVVKKIGKVKTGVDDKPVEPVKMTKVTMDDK